MTRDRFSLATHDHGGDGPPLVLLHGAGRTLADWAAVGPLLAARHRVLAVDLRAHGRSPSGPWNFPAVLGDLETTLDEHGVPGALPVGHSLGGMVAVQYALAHPDRTPGAVNLDGFGWGRPEQYVGLDAKYVEERLTEVRELAAGSQGPVLPVDGLKTILAQQRAMSDQLNIPYELLEAGVLRSLRERADGRLEIRPDREHGMQMLAAMDALDPFALFREMTGPLLLGRALRPVPSMPGMEWFDELMSAYAQGLARDLDRLRGVADVEVVEIDGTHAMLLENPRAVADAILGFTGRIHMA
ncbi:alpha/beta fold hydrolase [Streptomyces cavernae]|uniref:alpha/beta fold hydrolase n=1 Tax=Streptomyces cavernae TaxID=2259034 RepID=UPI000FEBDD04|nr:alpha/beta hydrolase [Streptomyces cavernae]